MKYLYERVLNTALSPAQQKDAIEYILKQLKMPITGEAMSMEALINENLEVVPNYVSSD